MIPPSQIDIAEVLKQRTRELHAQAESVLPLLDPELTLDQYRAYLINMFGFYHPLEQRLGSLEGFGSFLPDIHERWKCQNLIADLSEFGIRSPELGHLPRCTSLPRLATAEEAFGCWYVTEGATLGGRILIRHLKAAIGINEQQGGRFLAGYGAETGSRWNSFRQYLQAGVRSAENVEATAYGAEATFNSLLQWIRGNNRWLPRTRPGLLAQMST